MLTLGAARVLGRGSTSVVAGVLAADPVSTCLVASRFEQAGMDRGRLGGQFWGVSGGRGGLCFDGANLVPLAGDDHAVRLFAQAAGRRGRQCASVIGPAALVLPLWEQLEPRWGAAREVRSNQPLMACFDEPVGPGDPHLRPARPHDLDHYFPAAVAMFTEEVGVDPRWPDHGVSYRARLEGLIRAGLAFAHFDADGQVMVKAEIGALSARVALIQGVWVAPGLRGRGLAAPAMASLARHIRAMGRIPSLYVNDHNARARRAYTRVGFRQVGTFASVLF